MTTSGPSNPATTRLLHLSPVSGETRVGWLRRHGLTALLSAVLLLPSIGLERGGATARAQSTVMEHETTLPAAGLDARSEDGATQSLPLTSEAVTVHIEDGHATSTYSHVFQNESKSRLEGNYHLIVAEGATATGFSYWNGSERIVGEMFEREAARQVYEA